jgi:integrase
MPRDLPPRMLRRVRTLKSGKVWTGYYYDGREDGKRKEIPLGTDLNAAKRKWAELEQCDPPVDTTTMRHVFDRYERDIVPRKGILTQRDNLQELKHLRPVFDDAPIDQLLPMHVAQYRDARTAKTRGNREISLLSDVFNMAREWGFTQRENPCRGIKKNKETPRRYYADDEVWNAILDNAEPVLRDAMELAYLTGQRPSDVLKMEWLHIADGAIEVTQNKTGQRLRITIAGQLAKLIGRIQARCEVEGQGRTIIALKSNKDKTRPPVALSKQMRHDRLAKAKAQAWGAAIKAGNQDLAVKIQGFRFSDARSRAASDLDTTHASNLLGHTSEAITKRVYQRRGKIVDATR